MIEGFTDPILINRFSDAVMNVSLSMRQQAARDAGFDPRRNIQDECGFKSPLDMTPEDYKNLIAVDSLAARVNELFPRECWQVQPEVYEVEDEDSITPWEAARNRLANNLQVEQGYHKSKPTEGDILNEYLARADVECGKGRYGVILIGTDDGLDLSQPAQFVKPSSAVSRQLIYLRVFPEVYAQISQREPDRKNRRFGQPTLYNVTFESVDDGSTLGSGPFRSGQVHWSRIIHIVDAPTPGEILGTPRCAPVLYDLLTAQKPRYGSGEVYWKNALQKIFLETHPQLGGDVSTNITEVRSVMERLMNGFQQWALAKGMSAKVIAPASIDPLPYIEACIASICIKLGVPVRVFKGSERGELASAQDDDAWNDRLRERQNRFITPRIIVPFYNRLINLGVLPFPEKGYTVDWPDVSSQSEKDKADIGATKVTALSNAIASGLTAAIPIDDILTKFVGMDAREAQSIIDKAEEIARKSGAGDSPLTQTVGGIQGMVDLLKAQQEGTIQPDQLKQVLMIFYKIDEFRADALVQAGVQKPVTKIEPISSSVTNPSDNPNVDAVQAQSPPTFPTSD